MNARTLSLIALALLGASLLAVIIRLALPSSDAGIILPEIKGVTSTPATTTSPDTTSMNDSTDLKITDTKVGTGAEAVPGKKISVHYVGTLQDGTKFDSSRDRGAPFEFTLGAGQVIQGWDQGFAGMKVGGMRTLVIPPSLAYGSTDRGSIPANSTLTFEVELLGVE